MTFVSMAKLTVQGCSGDDMTTSTIILTELGIKITNNNFLSKKTDIYFHAICADIVKYEINKMQYDVTYIPNKESKVKKIVKILFKVTLLNLTITLHIFANNQKISFS